MKAKCSRLDRIVLQTALSVILTVAIWLAVAPRHLSNGPSLDRILTNSLEAAVTDLPTADARRVLQPNEILYKQIVARDVTFEVYVAHWAPGNPYVFQAPEHPPDICWKSAGWQCTEAKSRVGIRSSALQLRPGEWRVFTSPTGERQEVLFWCIAGDALVPTVGDPATTHFSERQRFFGSIFLNYWWSRLAMRRSLNSGGRATDFAMPVAEHVYFVRINSSVVLSEVLQSETFRRIHPLFTSLKLVQ